MIKAGDKIHLKPSAFRVLPRLSYHESKRAFGLLTISDIFDVNGDGEIIELWFEELPYCGITTKDVILQTEKKTSLELK